MPARLLLIRHGQTPGNVAQTFRGPEGAHDPLDEVGHAQAEALAQVLATRILPRPRLYASSYLRAQETGRHLADGLGLSLQTLPGIHEIGTGDWMGRPYSDMIDCLHDLVAPDGEFGYPGGESLTQVGQRFDLALQSLGMHDGETVLVVSHGAALVALLARLLGRDARDAWMSGDYAHANTALTELLWHVGPSGHEGGQPTLLRLADATHLQEKAMEY